MTSYGDVTHAYDGDVEGVALADTPIVEAVSDDHHQSVNPRDYAFNKVHFSTFRKRHNDAIGQR